MAFDAYNDYEQSEVVQKWLRQNGVSIIVGIAIGLIAIFGWQQWRSHQASNGVKAAELYQQAHVAAEAGNIKRADELTQTLQSDYEKSTYAVFAAADRAKRQVQAGQFAPAMQSLDWAVSHASEPAIKSLMQLSMAKVQFAAGKSDQALGTLDAIPATQYQGLRQELRGDVLVKTGRTDEARKAYQAALSALSKEAPQRASVQLKIDDLAAAGKQGA